MRPVRTMVGMILGIAVFTMHARSAEFELNDRRFTLPEGFAIERVAGPPLVDRPICADFDEQGRLYVADSSGSNDNVRKQLEEKPHRIVRLEDTDGDGQFDDSIVYADGMMFPEGAMWYDGSLYVAAPPSIWKLTDTDDDGVADQREEWFAGKTLTGCANDLHGPYRGPDGWIYWCKGAFAEQTYERPNGPSFVTRAAHIFRRRPEGGTIEPVMTGGMDNPVEVVFTPGGERIFSTTFLQHPGGGRRDGLIHAIYGGVYGKIHGVIDEHPRTGEVMPVLAHLGPAVPCGLIRMESHEFGNEYKDNVFAALFSLHKVSRHVLTPHGATFASRDEGFLVCDEIDFHPTDLIEDADGSLIVVDTGGWYKLCCPSSQLAKPDVLGAIYRVRRVGAHRLDDPRGRRVASTELEPGALARRLGDSRPAVRRRAIDTLSDRDDTESVAAVVEFASNTTRSEDRITAVWALSNLRNQQARAAVRSFLADPDEVVRQAAIHAVSVWRDRVATAELTRLLRSESAANRRAAAEALGRVGDGSVVAALLAAAGEECDRTLEHSITFALIEIADADATRRALHGAGFAATGSALMALDQMAGGGLTPAEVKPALASSDPNLRRTASWIVGRHRQWGPALTDWLEARIRDADLSNADRAELGQHLARFAEHSEIQNLLAESLGEMPPSSETARWILRVMAESDLKTMPSRWATVLARRLSSDEHESLNAIVATCRAVPASAADREALQAGLLRVIGRESLPAEVRLEALAALCEGGNGISSDAFRFVIECLPVDRPVRQRALAAEVITRAALTNTQRMQLIDALPTVSPTELERIVSVFDGSNDPSLALRLLGTLAATPAASALNLQKLEHQFATCGPAVQERAKGLCRDLARAIEEQKAHLDDLLRELPPGDVRNGQLVFNSPKAACSACHEIGYLGGDSGPDLTRIGQTRSRRDLLEAILFPSASFVRSYEPVQIVTTVGRMLNGVVRDDGREEIVLALSAEEEIRLPRQDIEAMRPGTVSIMPAGLDQQLTQQELADLLAFLEAAR